MGSLGFKEEDSFCGIFLIIVFLLPYELERTFVNDYSTEWS